MIRNFSYNYGNGPCIYLLLPTCTHLYLSFILHNNIFFCLLKKKKNIFFFFLQRDQAHCNIGLLTYTHDEALKSIMCCMSIELCLRPEGVVSLGNVFNDYLFCLFLYNILLYSTSKETNILRVKTEKVGGMTISISEL